MSERLTRTEALAILERCGIAPGSDYHALRQAAVDALLGQANKRKYRKRPDAPGSRARMFHAYVERAATR